jgi:flotillin
MANSEKAVGIAQAEKKKAVALAEAEAERAIQNASIMVPTEIEADRKKAEAEGIKQKIVIEADAEAEAIKRKAVAEAEAIRIKALAEAEGRLKIAEAKKAEKAAETADMQALLGSGMTGSQIVQVYLKEELKEIAEADAKKFEHINLGQVTVLGGPETAANFMGGIVKAVESVNTLKDNIPGAKGLMGLLDSFDEKHSSKPTQPESDRPEPENKEPQKSDE